MKLGVHPWEALKVPMELLLQSRVNLGWEAAPAPPPPHSAHPVHPRELCFCCLAHSWVCPFRECPLGSMIGSSGQVDVSLAVSYPASSPLLSSTQQLPESWGPWAEPCVTDGGQKSVVP